ncbi:hypothetical protein J500_1663 [Acinetobacter sp. 479375]|nr:hypothetical protein J500_1663 [Acinetobacter sp. 479375]
MRVIVTGDMDVATLDCGCRDAPSIQQKIFVTFHLIFEK